MKTVKPLWRLTVTTSLEAEDAVSELVASLLGQGAAAYYNIEQGISRVSVYGEKQIPNTVAAKISSGLKQIKACGLDIGAAKISIAKVRREDWAESWKKHFPPLTIGNALLVKPSWSRRRPVGKQAVVILDPGLSFGTGQHPTTAFCLSELVRGHGHQPARSILDVGTGSGILAIAAAKLGYEPVHAFDFDPAAVRIARENARINQVARLVQITRGDVCRLALKPTRRFDVVCANLISNLLIAQRRRLIGQVNPAGTLVLAGILQKEFITVQEVFAELGWKLVRGKTVREWRSGSFRRVGAARRQP